MNSNTDTNHSEHRIRIRNPISPEKLVVQFLLAVAILLVIPVSAKSQENKTEEKTRSSWEISLEDAEQIKNQAKQDFDRDMSDAIARKNQAIANLEKDLERARSRTDNVEKEDLHSALDDAEKIKRDAIERFDNDMAEAEAMKLKAAARFEQDLQLARKKATSLEQDVRREVDQGESKVKKLSDGDKPSSEKSTAPKTISLAKSGTPAGEDLENITELPKRIHHTELSEVSIPLQELPERPETLFYFGDPFFGSGPIESGFEIFTGAVWQPQFFPFGTYSTALQIYDDGDQQITEWVNALDIFGNLNLTPTERLVIGFTPLDNDGEFSGYEFHPDDDGLNALNGHVQTLFFEGRFDSLFPGLKSSTNSWASFDFALGRQPVNYQSGILINDTLDSIGITRTSLNLFGSPEVSITGLYGWNHINRGNNVRDGEAQLLGLFSTWNYPENQIEADIVLVYNVDSIDPSNGLNLALSSYQQFWGVLNATFSINQSIALAETSDRSRTGTLLFSQFNMQPPNTVDNAYMNMFWGISQYTSAARSAEAGGPLGQTGLLFAATGLGNFGPALPSDGQDMFGGSIGYERYLGSIRRRIIFEFGGVTKDSSLAFGSQFEQAIGRNFLLTLGSFVSYQENHERSIGYGVRSVFTVNF